MRWRRLGYLLPWRRRAEENDMQAELESLAAFAKPGELGNLTRAAEEARAAWGWTWLEQLYRDGQYALRTLRQNPGFTATAVLSLALGIGANTAIFSLIDALILRPLPVHNPQDLVQLRLNDPNDPDPVDSLSYDIAKGLAERKDIFSNACGFGGASFAVGLHESVNRVSGAWVTGGYFETLGLAPAAGRLLNRNDDRTGAPPVAVLSYAYWQQQFAGNPTVIGQTLLLNGLPVEIAGVEPRGFEGAEVGASADITMAVAALPRVDPSWAGLLGPGSFWMRVIARPRPDLSLQQAKTRLDVVWPQIAERVISPNWPMDRRRQMAGLKFTWVPGATGHSFLRQQFRKPLLVLMAISTLVLLIACANVASLLLARATARQREISIRLAIGAGRGRVVRQLLTESTFLGVIGAAAGIGLAWFSSHYLVATLSGERLPARVDLTPNWHLLAFAIGLALITGLLFGLAPAVQTTTTGGRAMLREGARATRSHSRLLSSLVSAQVALSLLLLVSAGLFVQTLQNLLNLDPGFRREGVLVVGLDGQREGYRDAQLTEFYSELLNRVRSLPGVVSASVATHTPLDGSQWTEAVAPKGQALPSNDNSILIAAGPEFFATMGTPLIAGREFDESDRGSALVAVANKSFADRFFPGRNALGEYVTASSTNPPSNYRIVGIVRDSITTNLWNHTEPTLYLSYFQRPSARDWLVVRSAGPVARTQQAIRAALQPNFTHSPVEARPLTAQVEETLVEERLMAKLSGGFGALGYVLACVGLYGLLAYGVTRRTKEIGVRMALGARRLGVVWMVASRALILVIAGVVLGLPASWLLSRGVKSMLFGLAAMDGRILAGAIVALLLAGVLAAYIPARQAARMDPMTALRHE